MSSLEETVLSADSESKNLKEKLNALTEEKVEIENQVASLGESLQNLETEKEVRCFYSATRATVSTKPRVLTLFDTFLTLKRRNRTTKWV